MLLATVSSLWSACQLLQLNRDVDDLMLTYCLGKEEAKEVKDKLLLWLFVGFD
jgi:hypothetical protein